MVFSVTWLTLQLCLRFHGIVAQLLEITRCWCKNGGWRSVVAIPLVPVLCRLQIAVSLCGFPAVGHEFLFLVFLHIWHIQSYWCELMWMKSQMMQNFLNYSDYSGTLEWDVANQYTSVYMYWYMYWMKKHVRYYINTLTISWSSSYLYHHQRLSFTDRIW
jgi:hypothetical protein